MIEENNHPLRHVENNDKQNDDIDVLFSKNPDKQDKATNAPIVSISPSVLPVTKEQKASWEPTLTTSTDNIVNSIINSDDPEDIKQLINGFNLNQSKKSVLRILKLNNLLDLVTEETLRRYQKHPDEISNKELLDCMTVVSAQMEQAQKTVNGIIDKPAIQINQQKNEVNVNIPILTKDQRENVVDVVNQIIEAAQKQSASNTTPIIDIDATTSSKGENKQ